MSKILINDTVSIDLSTLIDTRLLVQANSGGGKSWLLRRLLEQSHGTWDPSSNHLNCISDVESNLQAYQLYPVSLPFPTPIAFPLQYKYQ